MSANQTVPSLRSFHGSDFGRFSNAAAVLGVVDTEVIKEEDSCDSHCCREAQRQLPSRRKQETGPKVLLVSAQSSHPKRNLRLGSLSSRLEMVQKSSREVFKTAESAPPKLFWRLSRGVRKRNGF